MVILTDTEFNDELERTAAWVQIILKDNNIKDFVPALVVLGEPPSEAEPRKSVTIAVMPNFDMDKRHEILMAAGARFGREKTIVRAVYFVTEAWVSTQPSDEPRKYALPEQDPERREVIQVAAMTYDGRCAAAQIAVTRNKREQMVAGETELMPYGGEAEIQNNICKAFFRGFVMGAMGALVKA